MAEFILDNVVASYRDGEPFKFNTTIDAYTLAKLYENNVIVVNPEIQRGTKTLKSGKEKRVFSLKHSKDILKAMLSDVNFDGGTIFLRHNKDGEMLLNFDETNQSLLLSTDNEYFEEPVFEILDGMHRTESAKMYYDMWEKNPDSYPNPKNFQFPIAIRSLTDDEAKMVFSELATKPLPISKSRSAFLNVGDISNKISRKIMNESEIKGKIETVSTSIKGKNAIVTFAVLNESIRNNFKPATNKEADKVANYLIEYFNELVELFPEYLGNMNINSRNEARKKSFILEPLVFPGLLNLAKQLMNQKDWQEQLKKLREEVKVGKWSGEFLNKDNPTWKQNVMRDKDKIINNTSTQAFMTKAISNFVLGE